MIMSFVCFINDAGCATMTPRRAMPLLLMILLRCVPRMPRARQPQQMRCRDSKMVQRAARRKEKSAR